MMLNLKKLFSNKKWELVKTFKIEHTDIYYCVHHYVYHIHLFESDKGDRRAEYQCNGTPYNIDRKTGWLRTTDLYQLQIYRWLNGRIDPEIPGYNEIAAKDGANFFHGTIEKS